MVEIDHRVTYSSFLQEKVQGLHASDPITQLTMDPRRPRLARTRRIQYSEHTLLTGALVTVVGGMGSGELSGCEVRHSDD